ncbi:MAG: ATP-binding protein [Tunicatimonas sp.]|uniref:ATP-binding protein n=1 Tax=Tunicatimonas sp. TaxID=1940096 RepID=UPI003C7077DA
MDYLDRIIENQILESLVPNKVVVLIGPRRVGKTILVKQITEKIQEPYLLLNGEDFAVLELLERRSVQNYMNLLQGKRLLIIDEAQKIPAIGNVLKLMVDQIEGLKILVTGSSAFDISNYTGEPLTGRKVTYNLFALSEQELDQVENILEKKDNLNKRLVYGNYPELLQLKEDAKKEEYLREIVNAYLLKDILAFENIRNADKIFDLLRMIAFQIGGEVSMQELGSQLEMSKNTIEKYLDLLSKVYVIHKVKGFSKNLRKEVTKNSRWYFYDNGLRNTIIANLNPVGQRGDIGMLWENYAISERIKYQRYHKMLVNNYFWRTYDQQEIDWVEERGGKLYGYEFKWNTKKHVKTPVAWKKSYENADFEVIHPNNYLEWIRE